MNNRTLLIAGAFVLVSGASIGLLSAGGNAPEPTDGTSTRSAALGGESRPAVPVEDLRVDLLNRAAQAGPQRDAFSARAWQPAPPPPPPARAEPPPPPPPPAAPALPFTFMGKFEIPGDKTVYYLVEGDRLHTVTEGETIDGTYRIEAVNESRMDILYLPLSIVQTLALGAAP